MTISGRRIGPTQMTYEWNTGRLYTEKGQIIKATLDGDIVTFTDYSRMIDGSFRVYNPRTIQAPYQLQEVVMFFYDRGFYTYKGFADRKTAPGQTYTVEEIQRLLAATDNLLKWAGAHRARGEAEYDQDVAEARAALVVVIGDSRY
jgi:hypothetical protein